MTFILIFFSVLLLLLLKNKSLAVFLIVIQLVSIIGTYFLGREIEIETVGDYGWIFLIVLLLVLIILPWSNYYKVKEIIDIAPEKLKRITIFLIAINSIVFVVFLVAAIIVQTTVKDINDFKYEEGVSTDFYYNKLPFPPIFFNFAIVFYYFSYFILPLHFYYLHKKKVWLSIICFLLSLNIVLYGLTFFSRAVVVQYALLYVSFLLLLYGTLTPRLKKNIKVSFIILSVLSIGYFISISQQRFEEDTARSKIYTKLIPVEAITQDPVLYGYLDYTSQGFFNGHEVLKLYEGEGFDGVLTYESILGFISTPTQSYERFKYRQKLWPYHYSYSFNGFAAYTVYDYGILGAIAFCIFYFVVVVRMRPRENTIQLKDLFLIVLLIQIPLMSIFYSQVGGLFIAFLLWIPLWFYLKIQIK